MASLEPALGFAYGQAFVSAAHGVLEVIWYQLNRLYTHMRRGRQEVVMEVSSHSLAIEDSGTARLPGMTDF